MINASVLHLSKGDIIELASGEQGQVMMLARDVKSGEIGGYVILWKFTYKGEKISILDAREKGVKKINHN
jgi:hypothetical protein